MLVTDERAVLQVTLMHERCGGAFEPHVHLRTAEDPDQRLTLCCELPCHAICYLHTMMYKRFNLGRKRYSHVEATHGRIRTHTEFRQAQVAVFTFKGLHLT